MGKLDDALAARRLLNPLAVVAESEARLERLQPEARAAFALLCAQKLMDAHLRLPESQQRPFTLSWVPARRMIWTGLGPDCSSAKAAVQGYLNAFYEGPFNHDLASATASYRKESDHVEQFIGECCIVAANDG